MVLILKLARPWLDLNVEGGQLAFVSFSNEHTLEERVESHALDRRGTSPLEVGGLAEIAATPRWHALLAKLA